MTTFLQIDAFTNKAFGGNPAAVLLLTGPAEVEWMQAVARETNLPATAFVVPQEGGFGLRWFTNAGELELCGHGTLASAHALAQSGRLEDGQSVRFFTRAGELTATRSGEWLELDFPAQVVQSADAPAELLQAMPVEPLFVGRNRLDYLIEVADEAAVRNLSPDFALLRQVQTRGVIVTARSTKNPEYDFISRFFAPSTGLDEDPVTGSAHAALGPYWSAKLNKTELTGFQASARTGIVRVRLNGDRVTLSGQAVTVIRGELL